MTLQIDPPQSLSPRFGRAAFAERFAAGPRVDGGEHFAKGTFAGRLRSVLQGFVFPLLIALVLFAGLLYFVFPTSTWFNQRAATAESESRLLELQTDRALLQSDIGRLRTDAEIERLARQEFNLVFPGEEAYAVLPAPPLPVRLPTSWPFTLIHDEIG